MTTAKKADRRAEELGSGQGSVSNESGTSTGPGSFPGSGDKGDNPNSIGGAGSNKTANNRPGHKTHG